MKKTNDGALLSSFLNDEDKDKAFICVSFMSAELKKVNDFFTTILKDVGLIPAEGEVTEATDGVPLKSEDVESGANAVPTNGGGENGGQNTTVDTTGSEDLIDALPEPEDVVPAASTGASTSGTPLTSRPPPQTESHLPKEGGSVVSGGAGSTAGASAAAADVGFIEVEEKEQICMAGKVLLSFTYMPAANKVNLKVVRAAELPPVERGGSENIQIHLCVLPMRKQRFRTTMQPSSQGVFNQTFQFVHMTKDLLEKCAIRLRVYGVQRFSKKLMGEIKIPLIKIDLTSPLADGDIWKNLAPKGLVVSIITFFFVSNISHKFLLPFVCLF